MTVVLKVLIVLEAILEVVVEALEMRCLSFLIWVFLYCRNVFSLLLKMVFCRFVKVGSSSFCCRDVLMLAISVWRLLSLILVHLILFWMSECSTFFIMACSNLIPFHLICKVFGVTLFTMHLRLKVFAFLDFASCISNFSHFLASSRVLGVTLFTMHLRLKVFAVLDFTSCISNFSHFLASSRVSCL